MPAYKVSELTSTSAMNDTDSLYLIHGSVDAQITGAALANSVVGSSDIRAALTAAASPAAANPFMVQARAPFIDARSYGLSEAATAAVNTTALNAAIVAGWATGQPVYCPAGEYLLNQIVLPTPTTGHRRFKIFGDGLNTVNGGLYDATVAYGTRFISKAGGSDFIVATSATYSVTYYEFENLNIIGPDNGGVTTTSGDGFLIGGSLLTPTVFMRNVLVTGFRGSGKAGIHLINCEDGNLTNIMVFSCDYGYKFESAYNANTHINCGAQYCATAGALFTAAQSNVWLGGLFQTNVKSGVVLSDGVSQLSFIDTHFENNNTSHTAGEYAIKAVATSSPIQHVRIAACRFNVSVYDSIYLEGSAGFQVNDFEINGCLFSGSATITIQNAYVAYTRIIESLALASITDNGTQTLVLFQGVLDSIFTFNKVTTFLEAPKVPATAASTDVFALDSTGHDATITNNSTLALTSTNVFSGLLIVTETFNTGESAIFICGGNVAILVAQSGSIFTQTINTANKVNLYWAAGGVYTIQNKYGSDVHVSVMALRTRTA